LTPAFGRTGPTNCIRQERGDRASTGVTRMVPRSVALFALRKALFSADRSTPRKRAISSDVNSHTQVSVIATIFATSTYATSSVLVVRASARLSNVLSSSPDEDQVHFLLVVNRPSEASSTQGAPRLTKQRPWPPLRSPYTRGHACPEYFSLAARNDSRRTTGNRPSHPTGRQHALRTQTVLARCPPHTRPSPAVPAETNVKESRSNVKSLPSGPAAKSHHHDAGLR